MESSITNQLPDDKSGAIKAINIAFFALHNSTPFRYQTSVLI